MIDQEKQWLLGSSWDAVVALNRSLCQAGKLEPLQNSKAFAAAQAFWDRARSKPARLAEAFDACRKTRELSPFTFNNGNTFAAVGRSLVEEALKHVPAVEAQMARTTICHFIAGTVSRRELIQVLQHLAPALANAPAPSRPTTTDAPNPRLPEARPVGTS